jgi:hypothetical protein
MHLAYAEMYILIAAIFRRFGSCEVCFESDERVLELFDTREEDVEVVGELFLPVLRKGSEGIRFKVLGRET